MAALSYASADVIRIKDARVTYGIGNRPAVGYVTLINESTRDDALISVTSPNFDPIELHTHKMEDGIMRMRAVKNFPLPAQATYMLKPHGDHLMLFNGNADEKIVRLTFIFQYAPPITLDINAQYFGQNK